MNIKTISVATIGAAAIGLSVGSAAPAQAFSLWSWSYGSSTNGASGTFTTTDVSNPNNPVGTFDVTKFTLSVLNGNSVNGQDTSLRLSPQFVYNTATNYGFKNSSGTFNSSVQDWDGGASVGLYRLSGSAAYEASVPPGFALPNLITFKGSSAGQSPADLKVSLIPPTAVPTPALLPGLIGLGAAALRKRKAEKVQAKV